MTITALSISFANSPTVTLTRREYSGYAQVRHCSQSPVTGYKTYMDWRFDQRNAGWGDPSVFQVLGLPEVKPIFLTRQMQEWMFGLLRESAGGLMTEDALKRAWANLTAWNKAFTNKAGTKQGYADYILHINEDAPQGLGYQPVIATGATVKLVGNKFKKWNRWYQSFEVLDVRNPNTYNATYKNNWMHILPATNSMNMGNGIERIDPFPKMVNDRDTPWAMLGDGYSTWAIEVDWLRPMREDEAHPAYPYLPSRDTGSWVGGRRRNG